MEPTPEISQNNMMMIADFPDEIFEQILLRLPLMSVVRCKCVSKSWYATISDPNFCMKEFSLRSRRDYQLAVCDHSGDPCQYGFYSVHDKSFCLIDSQIASLNLNPEHLYLPTNYFGSYNGLWVLGFGYDIILFNPISKYCEKAFTDYRQTEDNIVNKDVRAKCGLCYDSSMDDYKLVLATEVEGSGDLRVTVFNVRAKTWRLARHDFDFSYEMCWRNNGVNLEEKIYWLVAHGKGTTWYKRSCVKKIIFFDANTDMLRDVPIPEPKAGEGFRGILGLGVLDGCLAMTSQAGLSHEAANNIEVWVMKEHGHAVEDSWTMLYTLEFLPGASYMTIPPCECLCIVEPFFLTNDGLVVLKVDDMMIAYDLEEESYFEIFPESYVYWFAVPHLATLKCLQHKVQAGTRAAAEGRSDWLEVSDD